MRLVAKGFQQNEGIAYTNIFSLVVTNIFSLLVKSVTIRIVLGLVARKIEISANGC